MLMRENCYDRLGFHVQEDLFVWIVIPCANANFLDLISLGSKRFLLYIWIALQCANGTFCGSIKICSNWLKGIIYYDPLFKEEIYISTQIIK